ncbi:MAG: D-alanyl-D-alanine carboxypeptidase/D-alanyl-D-alanine-endopeptidase, partial [Armatimonadetes bacterium CG_4_10_14_3_um_filter_59_10]
MTDIRQRPHRRRRRHAIVAVAFLIAGFAKVDASSLRDGIDACAQTSSLHGAIVGLLIRDAESGAALYELNTATRFVPASNVKLITAAAALKTLGGAYRCTTRITASTGTVAAGVVRGNLYLIGSGDPMLRMEHIDDLARQVAQRDIRSVEGRVIGDASLFSGNRWREGWNWDYLQWYFAPEVSGLSLNRNQVDVIVKPGLPGSPAHIRAEPETPYIRLKNDTQTVRAASSAAATIQFIRQFDSRTIRVAGRIPVASPTITQGMSVPRPALFAAVELTERLRKHGVSVRHSPATGASPGTGLQTIATRISVPLSDMIVYMNKRSDNHAAEQ